jgi:hypothetical protein
MRSDQAGAAGDDKFPLSDLHQRPPVAANSTACLKFHSRWSVEPMQAGSR